MSSPCCKPAPPRTYPPQYIHQATAVLTTGLGGVPAYAQWKQLDHGGCSDIFERFARLPSITKADMRRLSYSGFCIPQMDICGALEQDIVQIADTSGSTGDKVSNLWSQEWWDASEQASWGLNSIASRAADGTHREAILTSPRCAGFACEDGYLTMSERSLYRYLFLNERWDPTTWTPAHMDRMCEEINRFKPIILEANPSFLARLCRHSIRNRISIQSPELITFTYENPSIFHYRQIRSVFNNTPIASSYGSTETGYVFMECEYGCLHQNIQCCHVDFLPFKPEHGGPSIGSLLVTTFDNPWRVLLRFDMGDIARLASMPCPCGRTDGITLEAIEGRAVNLTMDLQGCAVTQRTVDTSLSNITDIDEYQVVQKSPDTYALSMVTKADPQRIGAIASDALRSLYGTNARISVTHVPFIHPDPPGKYRLTRALFDIDAMTFTEPRHRPAIV